jgi:hypothetical protein
LVSGADDPPWQASVDAVAPVRRRHGVPVVAVALGAVLIAGGSFAAGWFLRPRPAPTVLPAPPPLVPPDINAAAPELSATASAATPPAADPTATPHGSAKPKDDVDIDNDLPPDESDADLSKLLSYQGYLIVRSRADAEVFVNGVNLGLTNRVLMSRCYQRFVRLRNASTEAWITEGRPVAIECGATTTVRIDP